MGEGLHMVALRLTGIGLWLEEGRNLKILGYSTDSFIFLPGIWWIWGRKNMIADGDNYTGDSWILRQDLLLKDDLCCAIASQSET